METFFTLIQHHHGNIIKCFTYYYFVLFIHERLTNLTTFTFVILFIYFYLFTFFKKKKKVTEYSKTS